MVAGTGDIGVPACPVDLLVLAPSQQDLECTRLVRCLVIEGFADPATDIIPQVGRPVLAFCTGIEPIAKGESCRIARQCEFAPQLIMMRLAVSVKTAVNVQAKKPMGNKIG